jgi:hypothetical protein
VPVLLHRYRAPKEAKANRFKAAQTFLDRGVDTGITPIVGDEIATVKVSMETKKQT